MHVCTQGVLTYTNCYIIVNWGKTNCKLRLAIFFLSNAPKEEVGEEERQDE